MKTEVVNCRLKAYDIYIGRPSKWGNPFVVGKHGDRTQVIEEYRRYFDQKVSSGAFSKADLEALRGKKLGCYCAPKPCHGDVIVEYLESK